ncbi:MAG: NADH-quinone oxidoreductase subunit L [Caldisphaera sp.]|nr:MAG: NADH-quinone oxidoreductase subunit L [Caldisphaera sp.]
MVVTIYSNWYEWNSIWLSPFLGAAILALTWLFGVRNEKLYNIISVLSILVSAIVSSFALYDVLIKHEIIIAETSTYWVSLLKIKVGVYLDGLGAIMATIVSWLSFLIAVYSIDYMKNDWGVQRYFFFISFFVGSMLLLVTASNLILMFIGWEGTGLASYALIGHWYSDEEQYWVGAPKRKALGLPMYFEPSTSGIRAILFTRVGDVGFLVGITSLFFLASSMSIPTIASTAGTWMSLLASKGMLTAFLLIFTLGALAKSAQFPFHEWLVTAMTGPTPVSALIHAATMVKAGVYYILRFAPIFFVGAIAAASAAAISETHQYFYIVAGLAVTTVFIMATMAIVSNEFKLILAYSTAEYLGYMILAVAVGGLFVTTHNFSAMADAELAGIAMLLAHAVFKAALFLIAGYALHVADSRFIDNMGNYSKYMKVTAVSMWLAGLSLAAIPPFSGFFAKELVLENVSKTGYLGLYIFAVLAVFFTAAYISRLIIRVFHAPPYIENKEAEHHLREAPILMLGPYSVLAIAALVLGALWFWTGKGLEIGIFETLGIQASPIYNVAIDASTIIITSLIVVDFVIIALLYLRRYNFMGLLDKSSTLRAIHGFLYDRWFINSAIYYLVLYPFAGLSWLLGVINSAIDSFYHFVLPKTGELLSKSLRSFFRGRTDYLIAMYIIMASIIMLIIYFGW